MTPQERAVLVAAIIAVQSATGIGKPSWADGWAALVAAVKALPPADDSGDTNGEMG